MYHRSLSPSGRCVETKKREKEGGACACAPCLACSFLPTTRNVRPPSRMAIQIDWCRNHIICIFIVVYSRSGWGAFPTQTCATTIDFLYYYNIIPVLSTSQQQQTILLSLLPIKKAVRACSLFPLAVQRQISSCEPVSGLFIVFAHPDKYSVTPILCTH